MNLPIELKATLIGALFLIVSFLYRIRIGILTFFDIIVPFRPLAYRRAERYDQGRNVGRNATRGGTERNEKR